MIIKEFSIINNLKLKTSNNFGFGEFKLEVKAYSELGLTSLRSEVSNAIFDIYINPKVDAPVWIDNTNDDFLLED